MRLLRVYAQLVFSHSPVVGGLLLAATAVEPVTALGGAVSIVAAAGAARALGVAPGQAWEGPWGVNALLLGLGLAHTFTPGLPTAALVVVGALATVVVAAGLKSLLASTAALPVLSAPFLLLYPLLLVVAHQAGVVPAVRLAPALPFALPAAVALPLESLGSVLFLARAEVGLLVVLALLVHSRIAVLFAAAAWAAAWGVLSLAPTPFEPGLVRSAGLNAMLTALALGGAWFVPSGAGLVLAVSGGVLAAVLTVGLAGPLAAVGVPVLITPFYLAVALVLLATRQRAVDEHPKSVDFVPGTPEENLRHYRTQRERFASLYPVTLSLPFRGTWACTQAVDGEYTHQGPWRFAFDFEVQGDDGRLFTCDGLTPEDHHCHRLPVLAAADGTVVQVEGAVPDNALGGLDLEHNWGNLVMLHHAPGLYSLVAHLAPGSVRVQVGQVVRRGEVVGLCGNSGRSPRPHLHFQLQATAVLGAPTLPCRFAEVVRSEAGVDRLWRELAPARGDAVRAVEPEDEVARCLPFAVGAVVGVQGHGREETLTVEVDLLGRHVWRSSSGGLLYFARTPQGFVAQEALGPAGSVVHLVRVALARVPFEAGASLRWHDLAPSRWHGGPLRRLLRDFVAPFLSREGLEVEYRLAREAGRLVVTGRALLEQRAGAPVLLTRATLSPHGGLLSVEVGGPGRAARVATFTVLPVRPRTREPLSLQPARGDT